MTLQRAISLSLSVNSGAQISCIRIELPSGKHMITSQTLHKTESGEMEFIGLGDSVNVLCNYKTIEFNYTWYFSGLYSVKLRDIQFESCPRPLRLDTIAEVVIQGCSFRYIMNYICL